MIEQPTNIQNAFHLAGIIPVAGQPLDFNLPWHDSCVAIAPGYLAVERAVVECAYAGCEIQFGLEEIWILDHPKPENKFQSIMSQFTRKTAIKEIVWGGVYYMELWLHTAQAKR